MENEQGNGKNNFVKLGQNQLLIHSDLINLAKQDRLIEIEMIYLLQQAIDIRLASLLGHKTLKDYCETRLGMSEDIAYQRSQTARVCKRFPVLLALLKSGKTYVSHLRLLSAKATDQNIDLIANFLPGKSKRELEAFLSTLNEDGSVQAADKKVTVVLKLTLGQLELLRKAQTIMSGGHKSISDEDVFERSVDTLLDKIDPVRKAERSAVRKLKADQSLEANKVKQNRHPPVSEPLQSSHEKNSRPGAGSKTATVGASRYIPATARHAVFRRDQGRCTFMSSDGVRCDATSGLEIDHIKAFAHGGTHDPLNLRILCKNHNLALGEELFGKFDPLRAHSAAPVN